MNENKQALRHRLLNIFTAMNYFLAKEQLSDEERSELLELTSAASFLVEHEDLILGETPSFFPREVGLRDLLESIDHSLPDDEQKAAIHLPENNHRIIIDRYYIGQALQHLQQYLLITATTLSYRYDPAQRQLHIEHNNGHILEEDEQPLMNCINRKGTSPQELALRVSIVILKHYGAQLKESDEGLTITFPDKQAQHEG